MSWKACALVGSLVLLVTACTAEGNLVAETSTNGELAGFFLGFWHGWISPFTWFASLFDPNIGIYEVHNNGGWYNFGFLLGTGGLGGMGGSVVRSSRKARRSPAPKTYFYRT